MEPKTISRSELSGRIDRALAALSGTWLSASEGRIMLVLGSKKARADALRDLISRPGDALKVDILAADGLFLSLASAAAWGGLGLDANQEKESLRALAARYAQAGRQLVLVCNDVERAAIHDLGYLCRGINATVNDAYGGKPGILLILMGSETTATRRLAAAWPDAMLGIQSHHLA